MSAAFDVEKTRGVFTYPYELFGEFLRGANQGSPDGSSGGSHDTAQGTLVKALWTRKLKKVGKRGAFRSSGRRGSGLGILRTCSPSSL